MGKHPSLRRRDYLFLKEIVKHKIVCRWVLNSNQLDFGILQHCSMGFFTNNIIGKSFVGQQERKFLGDHLFQNEIIAVVWSLLPTAGGTKGLYNERGESAS